MGRLIDRLPSWILELVPILAGIAVAFTYFIITLPATGPFVPQYFLVAFVIYLLSRIPALWYYRTYVLPPLKAYRAARRSGRPLSQADLRRFYLDLSRFLPRHLLGSLLIWLGCGAALLTADQLFLVGTFLSAVTLLFTTVIIVVVGVVLSYYVNKARLTPVMEELQGLLERPPEVKKGRLPIPLKVAGGVLAINLLAFLAFGVLLYAQMERAIQVGILRGAAVKAGELGVALEALPRERWAQELEAHRPPGTVLAVVSAGGTVVAEAPARSVSTFRGLGRWLRRWGKVGQEAQAATPLGQALFRPGPQGLGLLVGVEREQTSVGKMFAIFTVGFFYLGVAIFLLVLFVGLFGRDLSAVGRRLAAFSRRMAEGDLRSSVPVWSDDELGRISDDLHGQFHGLRTLAGEVGLSARLVEEEIENLARTAERLHREVESQNRSLSETRKAVEEASQAAAEVSCSAAEVASSTQEVSSTVLELQASTEEISRSADVLTQSVEQTASSSNEIAAAAEEVASTVRELEGSGQEAVSFFLELDASLEETRRNAQSLLEAAQEVRRDAEAGNQAVREVGETIEATHRAIEESQRDLEALQGALDRIHSVTDVIQEISEQTNLLSLNASIIAAGAGEHGKAFAVVAQQIRELSHRTALNVREIRDHIRTVGESRERVARSVERSVLSARRSTDLSRSAWEALATILDSSVRQDDVSRTIAAAAEEVAHGGRRASRVIEGIFERVQQIGRATRQQVEATRLLHQEAEKVREVASQLRAATEEQVRGTAMAGKGVTRIAEQSVRTSRAMASQAEASRAITESVNRISAAADALAGAFGDLTQSAARLEDGARRLNESLRAIRV
ncbi:MAG: methyl-accepting chemotaxis protein [Acidobacteriota bacterium]